MAESYPMPRAIPSAWLMCFEELFVMAVASG